MSTFFQVLLALIVFHVLQWGVNKIRGLKNGAKEYIKKHTYGEFNLPFFINCVFEDIGFERMGKRFYEAKTHCQNGWFKSILNGFGIITSVRFNCGYPSGVSYYTWTFGTINPHSKKGKKKLERLKENVIPEDVFVTGTFVAGYNLI